MNECVRTGFVFYMPITQSYYVGDLFYYTDVDAFQVRGIPQRVIPKAQEDATVMNCFLCQRQDSVYRDTNIGITIIAPSDEFKAHIREWYPHLVNRIPGVKDGEAA